MRRAFVALVYPKDLEAAAAQAGRLHDALATAGGWRLAHARAGVEVWVWCAAPLRVVARDNVLMIGDYYPAPGAPCGHPAPPPTPGALAQRVLEAGWGQYAALVCVGPKRAILRDPSGMLDVQAWTHEDGVTVAASDPWRLPAVLRPPWPGLNWDRIAAFVTVPTAATTPSLFDGLTAVGPGEVLDLQPLGAPYPVWSPSTFAAHAIDAGDTEAAGRELLDRVVGCTTALVSDHPRLLMELSGGLDSSALAGVIGAAGLTSRIHTWLNLVDRRPEGDEATYAQAVTDRLGVPLTRVARAPGAIRVCDLSELAAENWPAIAGVDAARDRDEAARAQMSGATAIVSGQGGDAVFFQMGAPVVAADLIDAMGWRALVSPVLPDLARRTRSSVWEVLGAVHAARRGRLAERKIVNRLVTREVRAWAGPTEHAWTSAALASGLPLGKRLHIRAIASAHINHQISRRRRAADILFPLLAQPVVEFALRIPSFVLAGGAYDRPFQRALFADHLPEVVRARRAKGNASVYFARLMANSLAELRPYLLDGVLCDAGVLDRAVLEEVMTPHHLIWRDAANDLVAAIATEAWARHWQTRLPDSPSNGRR
jgi:asparagine synthase (glutamine-hydrolysing)